MNFLRFLGVKKPCPVCGEDFYPGHSHEEKPKLSRRGFLFMAAAAPVVIPQLPSMSNWAVTVEPAESMSFYMTSLEVAEEAMEILRRNLVFTDCIRRVSLPGRIISEIIPYDPIKYRIVDASVEPA